MNSSSLAVFAIIPARDESATIAATVRAVRTIPGVELVVVVDDGSTDDTMQVAANAGAEVVRHERNRGKGRAMHTGAEYATRHRTAPNQQYAVLFVDADLGGTAVNTTPLVETVRDGQADVAIALLPPQDTAGGGRGFVVTLARRGISQLTGWSPTQPLSGMRCLTSSAYNAVQPFAFGWGVEVGMTVDALRSGLRVIEVPCDLHHRVTGTDMRAQLHRARQYRDVWFALVVRRLRRR
ncbi:MAG: glycosyltransferase family 2 protein [Actinomycetota bacterium]